MALLPLGLFCEDSPTLSQIAQSAQWKALLHYRNNTSLIPQKSSFFLSPKGAKNPLEELQTTLTLMQSEKDAQEFVCRYPARAKFLSQFFIEIENRLQHTHCAEYEEFRVIVPSERISLHFAAESDIFPGSAMGHIYLALQGRAKADFDKVFAESVELHLKKDDEVGYSISFFADMDLGINPISYIRALSGNLSGAYALAPLENALFEYIENEKRSIWELELRLSDSQKDMILAHLWELKDIPLHYSFITHNCNDALKSVLSVASEEFNTPHLKPYQTPTEYIRALYSAGLISHYKVNIPQNKQTFVQKYGQNDILHSRASSRFSFGYEHKNHHNMLAFSFMPVYSQLENVNNAYAELIESALMRFEMRFNLNDNALFVERIEALHLFSVLDFFRTKNLSNYINVSFNTPIYEDTRTHLLPNISFGTGIGSYIGNVSVYILPIVGYDYVRAHNVFIDMRLGAVLRQGKMRFIGSYDYYIDSKNQRGYTQDLSAYAGVHILGQWDMYLKASYKDMKTLSSRDYMSLHLGVSVNF